MYEKLGTVTLKSGEEVKAGVVHAPDDMWADRIVKLLLHKGEPWIWQNNHAINVDLGMDFYFYILHRTVDGVEVPFANIMTAECNGVGIFGHVWTEPADRKQGASTELMAYQMDHFRQRNGQALFLGTGNPVAYRMYQTAGFQNIQPEIPQVGGYMAYYTRSEEAFNYAYFESGADSANTNATEIEPLDWAHWPASVPLFLSKSPGVVRCSPYKLIGRKSPEEELLPALVKATQDKHYGRPPSSLVLVNKNTLAVVGLAAWTMHPIWPYTCLLDIYCHPNYWQEAPALLEALLPTLPPGLRQVAYADASCLAKLDVLSNAGFRQTQTLADWLPVDFVQKSIVDVYMMVRG